MKVRLFFKINSPKDVINLLETNLDVWLLVSGNVMEINLKIWLIWVSGNVQWTKYSIHLLAPYIRGTNKFLRFCKRWHNYCLIPLFRIYKYALESCH